MVDYVVVSSDQNPLYREFLPLVTREWNRIGLRVLFLDVGGDPNAPEDTDYGKRAYIDPRGTPEFFAKIMRLSGMPGCQVLVSDIDMIPLSPEYFTRDFPRGCLSILTRSPYSVNPFHAMSYVVHEGDVCKLAATATDIAHVKKEWVTESNADETMLYFAALAAPRVYFERRDMRTRIDRSNWEYDIDKLRAGYYIDAHLPRPYSAHKDAIDKLIADRWGA